MRAKSKAWSRFFVHAEHQHVTVIRLDLASLQDQDARRVLEGAVVGLGVELAMLRENEPVDGQLTVRDPLAVVLYLGPSIVRLDGVVVKVQDHAGRKRGTASPPSTS